MSAPNRAHVAMDLEDAAGRILDALTDEGGCPRLEEQAVGIAQALAILSVGQRIAHLTDALDDLLDK